MFVAKVYDDESIPLRNQRKRPVPTPRAAGKIKGDGRVVKLCSKPRSRQREVIGDIPDASTERRLACNTLDWMFTGAVRRCASWTPTGKSSRKKRSRAVGPPCWIGCAQSKGRGRSAT